MKHIIFYSGGIGSYFAAKRVIDKHGKNNVKLLFTDTLIEDEDLYRFIRETSRKLGAELIWIMDGKDPWDVAFEKRFLPNSRIAQCSHVLKQKIAAKYIKENYKPDECILYLGIDWTEEHRKAAPTKHWEPYKVEFPLCEAPFVNKESMLDELEKMDRIERPNLYKLGFSHNNCGGFCFRAGIGHFKNLLEKKPDLYKYHEAKEEELRNYLDRDDISILRRSRNGKKINLTLAELRVELENTPEQLSFEESIDIGGCGCFIDDELLVEV